MGHSVAMCANASSGNLNFVYLGGGKPFSFKQTSDGVWHPTRAQGGQATAIPVQSTLTFTAIKGINGNTGLAAGLLAIDSSGGLWYTTQDNNDNWQAGGFSQLPNILDQFQQPIPYQAVDAAWVGGLGLVVVTLVGPPNTNRLTIYYQCLFSSTNQMAQPKLLGSAFGAMAVAGIDPQGTPTAVVIGNGAAGYPFVGYTSIDGVNWTTHTEKSLALPDIVALGMGNNATLQALALNANGFPLLAWDASGNGGNFVMYAQNGGQLPNQTGVAFSALAAGSGNQGTLQVVGIGRTDSLPYFFWQNPSNGAWNGCYQLPVATSAPGVADLCMGTGGQGFLQVGYLAGGSVYVNWQDTSGNWGWYGPLP